MFVRSIGGISGGSRSEFRNAWLNQTTHPSFQGGRKERVSNWLASASSAICSVCTSHFSLRPTNIEIRPR